APPTPPLSLRDALPIWVGRLGHVRGPVVAGGAAQPVQLADQARLDRYEAQRRVLGESLQPVRGQAAGPEERVQSVSEPLRADVDALGGGPDVRLRVDAGRLQDAVGDEPDPGLGRPYGDALAPQIGDGADVRAGGDHQLDVVVVEARDPAQPVGARP